MGNYQLKKSKDYYQQYPYELIDDYCQYVAWDKVLRAEFEALSKKSSISKKDGLVLLERKYTEEFLRVKSELAKSTEDLSFFDEAFSEWNKTSLQSLNAYGDYAYDKLARMRRTDRSQGKIGLARGYSNVVSKAKQMKRESRLGTSFIHLSLYEKINEYVERCAILKDAILSNNELLQMNLVSDNTTNALDAQSRIEEQFRDIEIMENILTKDFAKHLSTDDDKKKLLSTINTDALRLKMTEMTLQNQDIQASESESAIGDMVRIRDRERTEDELAELRVKGEIIRNYLRTGKVSCPSLEALYNTQSHEMESENPEA